MAMISYCACVSHREVVHKLLSGCDGPLSQHGNSVRVDPLTNLIDAVPVDAGRDGEFVEHRYNDLVANVDVELRTRYGAVEGSCLAKKTVGRQETFLSQKSEEDDIPASPPEQ